MISSMPPRTRRVMKKKTRSTAHVVPMFVGADWCLQFDGVPDPHLQAEVDYGRTLNKRRYVRYAPFRSVGPSSWCCVIWRKVAAEAMGGGRRGERWFGGWEVCGVMWRV